MTARASTALRIVAAAVLLAAGAAALAGCSSPGSAPSPAASPSPTETPRSGGVYNFPVTYIPPGISPFTGEGWSFEIPHQVFEGLVAWKTLPDGTVAVAPCLAQSWSGNADATVWTFRLRRGVRFQEPVRREMTAADVVTDIRYGAARAHPAWYAYDYAVIAGTDAKGRAEPSRLGVEALSRYTVRFRLKRPFASFPAMLGSPAYWVWPADYLRRVGRARFGERPAGTGPFVLTRLVRGESVDLARNPDWWDAASGRPYLGAVHFQVYPSVAGELLAFENGRVDYTWVPHGQVAASRTLPEVKSGAWTASTVELLSLGYVGFNMNDPVVGGERGLALRRAVNYACDREAMIARASDGVYRAPTGLVPPVLAGWADDMLPQEYDPAKAAALYKEAGSPHLRLTLTTDRLARSVAQCLRESCAEAGIRLSLRVLPWDRYVATFTDRGGPSMFLFGWQGDYPAADTFLYDLFFSGMSATTSGTAYANADVDRLLTAARATADPQQSLDLQRRAAAEIIADLPVLPLFEYADYRLSSARIGGFREDPFGWVDMWELWVR